MLGKPKEVYLNYDAIVKIRGWRQIEAPLDYPIKSGNDRCEVSFRGRTGVIGVSPISNKKSPKYGGSQGVGQ